MFHEGTAVIVRDAVASNRLLAACDGIGQSPVAANDAFSGLDDATIQFPLNQAFPSLIYALAKASSPDDVMMPERQAQTEVTSPGMVEGGARLVGVLLDISISRAACRSGQALSAGRRGRLQMLLLVR